MFSTRHDYWITNTNLDKAMNQSPINLDEIDNIIDLLVTNIEQNHRDMKLDDDLTYKDFAEYRDEQTKYAKAKLTKLLSIQVTKAQIDTQERFVGFLETMNESIPPENYKKIVEAWLVTETDRLNTLNSKLSKGNDDD